MNDSTVQFEHDKLFDKIIMKIIKDNQIVYYEEVTGSLLSIAKEYQEHIESIQQLIKIY